MLSSNRTGSFYMLLSVICFSVMDILVKLTTSNYPIGEIAFFRGLFGLIPIFFLIPKDKAFTFFKTKKPTLHFIRAFAGTFAMVSTFIGVKYMKLADVVSIAQATPVFVTIFSIIFLKEVVGYRRWLSVIAGLVGVLFITKPGTSLFNIYCIFPIFFCIGFSIVAVSIKRLSKTEPDYLIAFYFTALLIIISSTAFFFEEWKTPSILDFFYLFMIGICGSIANLFMTTAYRRADASLITPLKYLSVLSAIFFGYYIFSEIPSVSTIIGAIIIIISTFVIFKREQVKIRSVRFAMKKIKPPHYWYEAKKFLSKKDKKLAKIINQYDGHLVTRNDPFYSLCRSIIGQQISVKAADSIWLKFEKAIKKIKPINLIKLPRAKLVSIGLSRQKILYLRIIAKEFFGKRLDIKNLQKMSDEDAIKHLVRIKGIGIWTAQMFLIFNLNRSNIFPFSDIGLIKAISINYKKEYPLKKDQLDFFKNKWHPYTTVATWYMWRSIDPVPVEY